MTKRVLLIALCFVLVAALVFTGCAPARKPYTNVTPGTRTGYTTPGATGYTTPGTTGYTTPGATGYTTPGTTGYGKGTIGTGYGTTGAGYGTATGTTTTTGTTPSDRISIAVRQIQGVQNATAVINGSTAYVGITLPGTTLTGAKPNTGTIGTTTTTGTKVNANDIKKRAAQMVRAAEPGVKTVYVSTDASFINRLRTVEQGVRGGSPLGGFTTELRNIVRGIKPTK